MSAVVVAFAVVLLAEVGDKSQLVALSLASRFSPWITLLAVATASMVLHGLAATVGVAIAHAISHKTRSLAAGSLFIVFAVWTLWHARRESTRAADGPTDAADPIAARPQRSVFVAIALTFFISEFGDKTQIAVATLAATRNAFFVWIGAVLGMVVADGVAIAAGAGLRRVLRPRVVAAIAATGFAVTGTVLLASA